MTAAADKSMTTSRAVLLAVLFMLLSLSWAIRPQFQHLIAADLPNPDSYYNLVTVHDQDAVHGPQWVARDNAPQGVWTHWTLPYSWTLSQAGSLLELTGLSRITALRYGGGLLTALSMLLLSLATALAVASSGGTRKTTLLSGLVLASSVPLHSYGRIDQITHHIFLLLPLAAAAAALLRRADTRRRLSDLAGGGLLGLALWISPETMPFVVGLSGVCIAQRLQASAPAPLWPIALSLVTTIALAYWIDPPPPGFSHWAADRLSLSYVLLTGLLALVLLVAELSLTWCRSLLRRVLVVLGTGVAAAICWLAAVPELRAGPTGLIPPELRTVWWDTINELHMMHSLPEWVAWMSVPLTAAAVAALAAWRERSLWLASLAVMALCYGALGIWHARMGGAASLAACLAFCIGLSHLPAFADHQVSPLPARAQVAAFLLTVLGPLQLFAYIGLNTLFPTAAMSLKARQCNLQPVAASLNQLPAATVLTGIFSGPELLYWTHHRTLAGPYHHNVAGLLDSYRAWLDDGQGPAREIIAKRHIEYVLGCTHIQRELRAPQQRRTLAERVADGDVPAWLQAQPWPAGMQTDWRLYKVIRDPPLP